MFSAKLKIFSISIFAICANFVFASDLDAARDYRRIEMLILSGRESEAIVSVSDFLRRYPDDELADDVQFMLGNIYFNARKFELALKEYEMILKFKNKKLDRLADAGLKIGECWNSLKEPKKARIEWEAVLRRFPNSEAAQKAQIHLMGVK